MQKKQNKDTSILPWKLYITITLESLLVFFVTTFCIAVYFSYSGGQSIITSVILIILYVFSLTVVLKRIVEKFSLAALMIIVPIAPLIALMLVLSLIPILQSLK